MADVSALQQAVLGLQQLDCAAADPHVVHQALQTVLAFEHSPHQITRAFLAGAIASPLFKILPSSCLFLFSLLNTHTRSEHSVHTLTTLFYNSLTQHPNRRT